MTSPVDVRCGSCASIWSSGRFEPRCPECGGGALDRSCPICRGLCGALWNRAIVDSNDAGVAHWRGACRLADRAGIRSGEAGAVFEWWLDESALPDLHWACLIDGPTGQAAVVDMDARVSPFASGEQARQWLRQDEYASVLSLVEDGRIGRSAVPSLDRVEQVARFARP